MTGTYTIDEIKKISIPIAEKYGVKKLALFGSYARGEQKSTSDIDFVIEKGKLRDWASFCGFTEALEENLGIGIDVMTYDSLEDSFFMEDVIEDEVVLYER